MKSGRSFWGPALFYVLISFDFCVMKNIFSVAAVLAVLALSSPAFAGEPDAPGTKLITVQAGGGPGFGGFLSGNIAMANLGRSHLYGGLQLGADFRHGYSTTRTDLSVAPRLMLGFNLGRVFELHFGGLAGIAMQKFAADANLSSKLLFCWGGFGGVRLKVSSSVDLIAEGCYSHQLPYGTGGIAIRF